MAKRSHKLSTRRPRRSKPSSRKTMKRTKRQPSKKRTLKKHSSKKRKSRTKSVRKRKKTKKVMKGGVTYKPVFVEGVVDTKKIHKFSNVEATELLEGKDNKTWLIRRRDPSDGNGEYVITTKSVPTNLNYYIMKSDNMYSFRSSPAKSYTSLKDLIEENPSLFPKKKELKAAQKPPELLKKPLVKRPIDIEKLEGKSYYVGTKSKDEAEKMLKGSLLYTYLVRYGKDQGPHIYTISVLKQSTGIGHYGIYYIKSKDKGVGYGYYIKGNGRKGFYNSIEDLIKHYKSNILDNKDTNTKLDKYLNEPIAPPPPPEENIPPVVKPTQLYVDTVNYKIGEERDGDDRYYESMKVIDFTIYDEKLEGKQQTILISYTDVTSENFYLNDINPVDEISYVGKSIDDLINYYKQNPFYYTLLIDDDTVPKLLGNKID